MPQIIEVPGMGQVEFPDGMTDEQIVSAIRANSGSGRDFKAENPAEYDSASPEFQAKWGAEPVNPAIQVAGRTARIGAQAVAALPLAAADAGVGIRNLFQPKRATEEQSQSASYELPSVTWNRGLDALLPAPEDTLGKAVEFVGTVAAGSRVPVPGAAIQAPAAFKPALSPAAQILQRAQQEGLVVPPSTSNPTALNKTLEGVAGKLTTAQAASAKNQAGFNKLANRALGLPEDAPLTIEGIRAVRAKASESYEAIRKAGRIVPDNSYRVKLTNLVLRNKGAANDFPELAKTDLEDLVSGLNKEAFDADSAVSMIAILRDKADDAYRTGSSQAGRAYKEASKILEDEIEAHLSNGGKEAREMLRNFRDARQLMAKTYTVERSLNQTTGNVSGTKLAQQLAKGKPLTGDLKLAAQFSQAFPKAAREFNESLPGISPLDFYGAGGISAMSGNILPMLYPFARQGTRNALLSQSGQRLAIPGGTRVPSDPFAAGTANALLLLGQE